MNKIVLFYTLSNRVAGDKLIVDRKGKLNLKRVLEGDYDGEKIGQEISTLFVNK